LARNNADAFRFAARIEYAVGMSDSDHVYKNIELTGSSKISMEDAVQTAIARANKSVRNMRWFEVTDTRGHIVDGKVDHWQVTVKIGFTMED
tara:strand:+ start:251 stop:526 length:276 start_codon:yes stop_codon:yes gene_type:complete